MSKNRIKEYCPEAWEAYLWEQTKHEPMPACLDFAAHLCALEQAKEPQSFAAWSAENAVMGEKLASEIVQRSLAREKRRARARKTKPPQS